ncbi:putative UDP-glycosyltransferase 85A7-like [Capsicum annuum]|nr:putative UDP-glycosyltransferase 85A7-like [Capsicum annuum]KAF3621710.1 putative UDP-glycosyltransferase 85A7-like [Capsicum annuum]
MEVRLIHDEEMFKESVMALISHLQNSKNDLPAIIFNMITNSTSSNETSSAGLMNDNWLLEDLHEKKKQESTIQKELNNLKDSLTFEMQNSEVATYDCDKFRSLRNEKDAELQVFVKYN